jgi:hypothetical protein
VQRKMKLDEAVQGKARQMADSTAVEEILTSS